MTMLDRLPEFQAAEIKVNSRGYTINGQKYARVTSALGIINKPGLVGWARKSVLEKAREVIKRLAKSSLPIDADAVLLELESAGSERDAAATLGAAVHTLIQQLLTEGALVDLPPALAPMIHAAAGFLREYQIQPIHTEFTVWDEARHVAGTIDGVGLQRGKVVIWDWKTGRSLYPETALQLAAYATLFRETTGVAVQEAWAVRLPKNEGETFEARRVADVNRSYATYILALELQAELKRDPWTGEEREEDA